MNLAHLLVFALLSLLLGRLASARWRTRLLLAASVLAIYWLQPALPIRHLDFWLPTATLALVVIVWAITRSSLTPGPSHKVCGERPLPLWGWGWGE